MVLSVLRKLFLQTHMCSHPVGLYVWYLVGTFIYFSTSMCANREGSGDTEPKPSLVAYVISTIISWAGSFLFWVSVSSIYAWTSTLLGLSGRAMVLSVPVGQVHVVLVVRAASFFLNPHLPNGLSHPYQLDESISSFRGGWCTFSFLFYFE